MMITFPPVEHIVSSFAHAAQACLSHGFLALVERMIIDQVDGHYDEVDGDAVDDGNDEEVDDDDDDLPVKLVVDSDGVDEVESIEPEEETGDPAGQLMDMVVIMMILLMNMLTCNSSREVAV